MKIVPRDYQNRVVELTMNTTLRSVLASLPTGTGKTVIFSELARRMDVPTLILAHRDELIWQAEHKLRQVWSNADIGVVKAEVNETKRHITIASVPTLARGKRLVQLRDDFGLIITDEAHHAPADSYRRIYHRYGLIPDSPDPDPLTAIPSDAKHLGVTATPIRNDKLGLASIYEDIIYQAVYKDFVEQGYLCDLKFEGIQCTLDLNGVESTQLSGYGRDFQTSSLSEAVNTDEITHNILTAYQTYATDRNHTLVFCVDRKHAQSLYNSFLGAGIPSGYIDGETTQYERNMTLERFRNGDIRVLFNILVFTEGFDFPAIDCILLARPSKSPALLTQMIGRGTRTAPNKTNCLVLDVAHAHRVEKDTYGNVVGHAGSLLDLASLFYPPLPKLAKDKPTGNVLHPLAGSTGTGYTRPSEYFLGETTSESSIFEYLKTNFSPVRSWHYQPATPRQIRAVKQRLPNLTKELTRGEASALLDKLYHNKSQKIPDANTCGKCGGWKQAQYSDCYTCAKKRGFQ